MHSVENRRIEPRLALQIFVQHIFETQRQVLCVSEDLSPEGMRLVGRVGDDWGQPQHVWLRFQLPGEAQPFQALGELRYEGPNAQGLPVRGFRFKYMYPRARRRYEAFVRNAQVASA